MVVIGIDPGLATVGVGIVEKCENTKIRKPRHQSCGRCGAQCAARLIDFCTIETSPTLSTSERLLEIASDLSSIVKKHRPDFAVVEKIYFATNRKTAMDVAQARGVILFTVEEAGIPILEPTPLELKLAVTGDGRADKRQVKDMLLRMLRVPAKTFAGGKDDATDAVALAVYGAFHRTEIPVQA